MSDIQYVRNGVNRVGFAMAPISPVYAPRTDVVGSVSDIPKLGLGVFFINKRRQPSSGPTATALQ